MDLNKVVWEIREFADGGKVSLSLFRRKGRRNFYLRVYGADKRDKNFSLNTADRREAKDIEGEIRSRLNQAALMGIVPCNIRKLFDDWLAVKERQVAPNSYKRYRAVIEKALPFMPDEVHRVTFQNIEQYADWLLREGYKPWSMIIELNTIKQIFGKAKRLGYTSVNPCDGVRNPKRPTALISPYTDAELEAIFAEMERRAGEGLRKQSTEAWAVYREIFYCLYFTGMRVSDVIRLRWESISLPFSTIRFKQTKTGREAHVRIPTKYVQRLQRLAGGRKRLEGLVYCNTGGNGVRYAHLDAAMRSVLKSCGIVKKSPIHSFRHGAAMRLLSAGVPVHEVANQLGDSVETIVRAYVSPAVPAQMTIDNAYGGVSRKCHENMVEMADFEGAAVCTQATVIPPKSPLKEGFLCDDKKPLKTAIF